MRSQDICLLLAGLFILCSGDKAFSQSTFRCGSELVSIRDTTYEVLNKCGVPDIREIEVIHEVDRYSRATRRSSAVRVYAGSKTQVVSSGNEKWYYDPGPSGFIYVLEFRGSRVRKIQREGYGTDKGIPDWQQRRRMIQ